MSSTITPALLTKKGAPRSRQTMSIEKLNTIKRMIDAENKPKEIQKAIGVSKTCANKYYNLVLDKIQAYRDAGIKNPGSNLSSILSGGTTRNIKPNEELHREIYQILAEDNSLKSQGIHEKLVARGFNLTLPKLRKTLSQLTFTYKRVIKRAAKTTTNEMIIERNAYARTIRTYKDDDLIFLDETGFNL